MFDTSRSSAAKMSKSLHISSKMYLRFWIVFLLFASVVLILYTEPEIFHQEEHVMERLGELHVKEQHLNLLFRLLNEKTSLVMEQLNNIVSSLPLNLTASSDINKLLRNITVFSSMYVQFDHRLRPPSVFHFLPNLLQNMSSLVPANRITKNRTGVSVVIGIPTVKRLSQSYLMTTLNDLLHKLNDREKEDSLIVVFIAEVNETFVNQIISEIKDQFDVEIESGLIDIISPPASYYPDFGKLTPTLSDSIERVKWRSKQSLDFAFLMMYSFPKGMFYVQLEDDILAKPNFLTIMKSTALKKIANKEPWFVLDFCQLGFIGKMFRCTDLPWVIQFFIMFFNDKPVDWLLDGLIQTKVCNLEKDSKDCKLQKEKLWVRNKPSLFQHIGATSSLKGKVQRLKDKHFGKIPSFYPHRNPPAKVETTLKTYKKYELSRAYNGESFFWAYWPKAGDSVTFRFDEPFKLKRYRFRSGNFEFPSDKFYNTSIKAVVSSTSDQTDVTLGEFNHLGIADGFVDSDRIGCIKEIRFVIRSDSINWVILSEILIEVQKNGEK